MAPLIRSARRSDVAAVLALWAEAEAEPTHTDDVASLRELMAHDGDALLVAEEDGRLVGSVIGGWDGWRGSIYRLAVAPSHRRRGLAGQLVAAAEARLAAAGAVRLQSIAVADDPRSIGFWRASGWEEQVQRLRFVKG